MEVWRFIRDLHYPRHYPRLMWVCITQKYDLDGNCENLTKFRQEQQQRQTFAKSRISIAQGQGSDTRRK